MDNQHRKIAGYRELSQDEIDLINEIKTKGAELGELVAKVRDHVGEQDAASKIMTGPAGKNERVRLAEAQPDRWASIGATHLQEGLMALTRSVAQPTFF